MAHMPKTNEKIKPILPLLIFSLKPYFVGYFTKKTTEAKVVSTLSLKNLDRPLIDFTNKSHRFHQHSIYRIALL
jgi:hypothetical protein